MAITKPNKKKRNANSELKAGERTAVKNQVTRDEIVPEVKSVTFPANIRVDNHIRNQVTALLNIGISKNMKELIIHLIELQKEKLEDSQLMRFEKMTNILEEKDYVSKSLKQANKNK